VASRPGHEDASFTFEGSVLMEELHHRHGRRSIQTVPTRYAKIVSGTTRPFSCQRVAHRWKGIPRIADGDVYTTFGIRL